tara:strand:+ start:1154 stop:1273 length:120 start_codon:yes stop_codon:yes gene_type:complete
MIYNQKCRPVGGAEAQPLFGKTRLPKLSHITLPNIADNA